MKQKLNIDKVIKPLQSISHNHAFAGIILLICALTSLVLANSPLAQSFSDFWHLKISLNFGTFKISNSLLHWVNDGLMAIFFFVIGLELKRELMAGDLSTPKKALLPIAAAVGGMAVPAAIFLLFNPGEPGSRGWGIPMATDIAFALGILALLGSRVPPSLKVFIAALAIADDLGAVLVIAFFYTSQLDLMNLLLGGGLLVFLGFANWLGVRNVFFYGLVGVLGIWLAFLSSGVHATIAGVLIAFTIPARARINEIEFIGRLEKAIVKFKSIPPNDVSLLESAQAHELNEIQSITLMAHTPLQRLERSFNPFVLFLVMPIFALANAQVSFLVAGWEALAQSVTWGVFFGLLFGKWIGIVGISYILIKLGWASLPEGVTLRHLFGGGFICGVGFTMSLFITSLAFDETPEALFAKAGIVMASIVAGVLGYVVLRFTPKQSPR